MRNRWNQLKDRVKSYFTTDVLSFQKLLNILLPIFWEQAFLAVLAIAYIWLMSLEGEGAMSVVGMMTVVNKIFTSACLGLVTGGTVMVAQNIGAGRKNDGWHSMLQAMGLAVVITALLGGCLIGFREPIVGYLLDGADGEIVSGSMLYFSGFCLSFPCFALYQSFAGGMRGWGKTKIAWRLTLFVNCAEFALTILLVVSMRLGVMGVTLSMVLSRLAGAVYAGVLLCRERRRQGFALLPYLRVKPAILRGILIVAIPLALEQFFFNSGKAVSQRFIAGYGTAHMAANGVVNAIFDLFNLPQIAFRESLVTVVGLCIGAGRPDLAKAYIYKFLRAIRKLLIILLPLTIFFSAILVWHYKLSDESNRLTFLCLTLIFILGPLLLAGSFAIPAGLRAGGDAAFVSVSALCCMWGVRVTLSYLFCVIFPLGVLGINLAMVVEWFFRGILFRIRLRGELWHSHKLLTGSPPRTP